MPSRNLNYKLKSIQGDLRQFAHLVHHIEFDKQIFKEMENKIFTIIAEGASDALISLKLFKANLVSKTMSNGCSVFANLERLDVDNYLSWRKGFSLCTNLRHLDLFIGPGNRQLLFSHTFSNLRSLEVECDLTLEQFKLKKKNRSVLYNEIRI